MCIEILDAPWCWTVTLIKTKSRFLQAITDNHIQSQIMIVKTGMDWNLTNKWNLKQMCILVNIIMQKHLQLLDYFSHKIGAQQHGDLIHMAKQEKTHSITSLSNQLTFFRNRIDTLNNEYWVTGGDMLKAINVYRKEKYSLTSRIYEIQLKHS